MDVLVRKSKELSWLLRHAAGEVGIRMDPAGWVAVDDVLAHLKMTRSELERVVRDNDKRRLQLEADRIRCCQGHSRDAPVELEALEASWAQLDADAPLFHGTYADALASIATEGLLPQRRTHVHLTDALESKVGKRSSVDVMLEVDPRRAREDGVAIFRAPNGVILARRIPRAAIVALAPMTRKSRRREAELRAALGL